MAGGDSGSPDAAAVAVGWSNGFSATPSRSSSLGGVSQPVYDDPPDESAEAGGGMSHGAQMADHGMSSPVYDGAYDDGMSHGAADRGSPAPNPATRYIRSGDPLERGGGPGDDPEAERGGEALEQRFHQLALEAKLARPDRPFQTPIDELYRSAQRQGIAPADWAAFIDRVVSS